jgi:hypothetical protein
MLDLFRGVVNIFEPRFFRHVSFATFLSPNTTPHDKPTSAYATHPTNKPPE